MKKLFPGISRKKKRQLERRNSIIQAAVNLLKDKGYEQTTMQDIAEAADLSTFSVYYYFESKLDILDEALNVISEGKNNQPPITNEKELMKYFEERLKNLGDLNLFALIAESKKNPELLPRIQKMLMTFKEEIVTQLNRIEIDHPSQENKNELIVEMILSIGFGAFAMSSIDLQDGEAFIDMHQTLTTFGNLLSQSAEKKLLE
jgi:AcrR family transcriptional regulator